MKAYSLVFSLIIAVSFVACKESKPEESPLYKEVMAIHDAAMPEAAEIMKLRSEFKNMAKEEYIEEIRKVTPKIIEANDAMNAWMNQFKMPLDPKAAEPYLIEQKAKIQVVADQIKAAKSRTIALQDSLKALQ
jgi:hypothetical protein